MNKTLAKYRRCFYDRIMSKFYAESLKRENSLKQYNQIFERLPTHWKTASSDHQIYDYCSLPLRFMHCTKRIMLTQVFETVCM